MLTMRRIPLRARVCNRFTPQGAHPLWGGFADHRIGQNISTTNLRIVQKISACG